MIVAKTKAVVAFEETIALMDIRIGTVLSATVVDIDGRDFCVCKIDLGKFGVRSSVGRFSRFGAEAMVGMTVVCVINLGERAIGGYLSEVLTLGVQCPKQPSGEAQPLTVAGAAKLGGKVF